MGAHSRLQAQVNWRSRKQGDTFSLSEARLICAVAFRERVEERGGGKGKAEPNTRHGPLQWNFGDIRSISALEDVL